MNHLPSILWLAMWPLLICAIYRITYWVIQKKGYLYDEKEDQD